uniref:Unique cartilage matrix-associated protein n=1 Tax=Petromyzon marinus TaxID=7757 RepID=A0AAJ7XBR5_PETMA|nr:unique cartilage matrix-associated protein-like [Petromyzon marinus]
MEWGGGHPGSPRSALENSSSMDRMAWLCAVLTAAGLVILGTGPCEVKSASVSPGRQADAAAPAARGVFVRGDQAAGFLHKAGRARRSPKSRAEQLMEARVTLTADRRRSEHREEQLARWENWVEEEKTESYERHRESSEQWREWHFDGVYPPYQ